MTPKHGERSLAADSVSPRTAAVAWLRLAPRKRGPESVHSEAAPRPAPRRSRALYHAAALALLAGMGFLLPASMRDESPTTDEAVHLTRGVSYYWGHGASLSYAHPPLGNALAAIPVVLREQWRDVTKIDGYDRGAVDRVARALLVDHYPERRRWFFEARAAVSLIALAMAGYCYFLASALFGPWVGLVALGFVALHPTLIAHGRLMTTDMPVTAAMFVCLGEFVLFLIGRSRWHAASAALMFGAAITTKYTALALLPLLGAMAGACALLGLGRYAGMERAKALKSVALFGLFVAATGLLSINAVYRFDRTGMRVDEILQIPEPVNQITRGYKGLLLERRSVLKFLPGWVRLPVPYTYVYGLTSISVHERGGHSSAFFGTPQRRGHPMYFPVLLAIKTPLLQIGGLIAAAVICVWRRGRVSLAAWLLTFFAGALLLAATRAGINIGIRHILPMLPVLAVLAGLGAVRAFSLVRRSELRTSVIAVLIGAHVWGMSWCFPDYISDFNALVGGRIGGERISIVGEEWGQDMKRMGAALQEQGIEHIRFNVDTFTSTLELAQFGVAVERLGCPKQAPQRGWVAISARESARYPECSRWAEGVEPKITINNHIRVYRMR